LACRRLSLGKESARFSEAIQKLKDLSSA